MPYKKYSDFIEISPTFESVVDIDADTRNKNLWREYIVGEDMEKMMEVLCQSLNKEEPDSRRSFWIELRRPHIRVIQMSALQTIKPVQDCSSAF